MTPDEVCEALTKIGVPVLRGTLLNFEKEGLIPKAKRTSGGRGIGRQTDYPEWTVEEAFAAWVLIHGKFDKRNPLYGVIHEISYATVRIARNNYYENICYQSTKEALPEDNLELFYDQAAKYYYNGIKQLWRLECNRAQSLLQYC